VRALAERTVDGRRALVEVHSAARGEVIEIVETTSPPVRPVERYVGMVTGDELGEMTPGEAAHPCQEDPHGA
jgi:hypothetical protein